MGSVMASAMANAMVSGNNAVSVAMSRTREINVAPRTQRVRNAGNKDILLTCAGVVVLHRHVQAHDTLRVHATLRVNRALPETQRATTTRKGNNRLRKHVKMIIRKIHPQLSPSAEQWRHLSGGAPTQHPRQT